MKASFEQANYPLANAFDTNGGSGWAVAPEMGKDHAAQFAIDGGAVGFPGGTELEFKLQFSGHFGLGKFRLAFAGGAADPGLTDAAEPQGRSRVGRVSGDAAGCEGGGGESGRGALVQPA